MDDALVKVVAQSPAHQMQLMLNIYELRDDETLPAPASRCPKVFEVSEFRGWRPASGPGARPPAFPDRGASKR